MHGETLVRQRTRRAAVGSAAVVATLLAAVLLVAPAPASAAGVTLDVLTGLDGSGRVVGLADGGVVAGNVTDDNDLTTAFVWNGLEVYQVLPTDATASEAVHINGAGTLVGTATTSGGEQAFARTSDGTIFTADLGNGMQSQSIDIAEDGTVLGVQIDAQLQTTPFTWTPPAAPQLWPLASDPDSPHMLPQFINDAGQIAGEYIDQGSVPFFYDPANGNTITFVEDLASFPDADLVGLTEDGTMVLTATENGQSISYVWNPSTNIQQLSSPGYPDPIAMGVDGAGTVVGAASGGSLPFTWTASGGFSTLAACGTNAAAVAVNAAGQVVGGCQPNANANLVPNVWRGGESVSLGVPSAYSEGGAGFVNATGQVAGSYVDQAGTWFPFRASVVFETSPPEALAASAGDGQVDLTWQEPADDGNEGPSSYNIYESGALVGTVDGGVRSFRHTGLTNGTAYAYTVTAVNSAGESDPSAVVTAVPGSSPVARPVVATPRVTG